MEIIRILKKLWFKFTYRFKKEKINIQKVQLSGEGNFIDVRYSLNRPDKALVVNTTYLIDELTGKLLYLMALPRMGKIQTRHKRDKAGGVLLFRNLDGVIKPGSKVTLVFGKFEVKNIVVE